MDSRNFAKSLRRNMTDAEQLLWRHLRAHRLNGEKFRRQQPLGPYIVDFIHFDARLIVEADGGQHNGSIRDQNRDAWLEQQGFKILRFWNNDILNNTDAVLTVIFEAVSGPLSPSPSPARGEGSNTTGQGD
ncbi:endonuclease domain-containing protein [Permianibacter sp. IMCC34836]|uniref:endonuclease domain-containing protein n=1 Tax=Permianibacter fluminis TaxID=2738515 RepID=UPI001556D811|nr:endonuclease domain-containing protein [Permianibacter fluminis]NQD36823.1 endonuclease domain-containing protein [Permianibacter fluminis]